MIGVPPDYNLAPYELSLCRAGKSPLHLVATILSYDTGVKIEEIFSQYGPRFRTINLSKDTDIVHPEIFTGLLHHCVAGSLSELSIKDSMSRHTLYNNEYYSNIDTIPDCEPGEHTFPPNAPQTASFLKILGSLTAFRIRGFLLPWRDINFSSRLVQLHIAGIRLGYDHTIAPFLQALSSASELRDLKIISVVSFHKDNTTSAENALPIVTLPKLRSFHLQDLYFNTLRVLLSKITPGLPCLTLSLSFKSVEINRIKEITWGNNGNNDIGDDDSIPTIGELWAALGPIQADTLRIGEGSRAWLDGPMIRTFVRAMPILKTLQMDDWFFSDEDNSILSNLIRSHNTQSDQDGLIPALENIHLTRFALNNAEILQEMVSSHPVQQIILGGDYQGH
ncbi:hypothetical protein OPQ81_007489 [Rhizoctonia solani]|nr:hypothetical protein OPQ81_007489 [Rhizoctonia solani]